MKVSFLLFLLAFVSLLVPAALGQSSEFFRKKLSVSDKDINRRGSLPNSFATVVEKVLPAVVSISSARVYEKRVDPLLEQILRYRFGDDYKPSNKQQRDQQGLGSGVLVTTDGFIITNNHVITGANEITVTLPKSRRQFQAELVATDPSTDVALLKIDGDHFPRVTLANSDRVKVGDVVLAVGNPFELEETVTQGIVSALGRSGVGPSREFYGNFIQTDASINPGNSGGALVDSSGRVIGINSMIYSTTGSSMGIGFAIPINMALRVINSLLDEGQVTRGFLGVSLGSLSPEGARYLGRQDLTGAVVTYVVPNSPADAGGLAANDLIVDFEGKVVRDATKLRLAVSNTPPGTEVNFGVIREGRKVSVSVVLGKRQAAKGSYVNRRRWDRSPDEGEPVPVPVEKGEPLETPFYLEGVQLQTLDDAGRQVLGLDVVYEGAVVMQVDPHSAAGRRGLQVKDVIVEVGRTPIASTREALLAGESIEGDSVVLGIIRDGKEQFVMVTK